MKYFLDTEFLEGPQNKKFLGIKYGETKPTIDLISIGIVSEDGREYYAISKDFNLKEAWNRFDLKWMEIIVNGTSKERHQYKKYWIRENVLKPIWEDLSDRWSDDNLFFAEDIKKAKHLEFTYSSLKSLLKKYGKSNEQIAKEVKEFVDPEKKRYNKFGEYTLTKPDFYAYYADYDWVCFCWLFGCMIDLPDGFPMYCRDLKQMLDEKIEKSWKDVENSTFGHVGIQDIKNIPGYPKQTDEHNALYDAIFCKKLYHFIQSL